jgi:putative transposase
LNGRVAHLARNVKRWKDGQMTLRWVAGAFSEAKQRSRSLCGHREMKTLFAALAAKPIDSQCSQRTAAHHASAG